MNNIIELLNDEERQMVHIRNYKSNQVVFNEDDLCNYVGFILSGEIIVKTYTYIGREETINVISTNKAFGQYLAFSNNPYYLGTAITTKNTKIAIIYKHSLIKILQKNTNFLNAYLSLLSLGSLQANQQAKLYAHKNIRDRIMYYLSCNCINHYIEVTTITDLAEKLSIPRPSLSRELTKMEKDELIFRQGKKIFIKKEVY